MQKTLFLLLACFFSNTAKAQYEEKNFVLYTVREGLSENYITCLQQDNRGYIWVGTDIGLNRFDGHSFKKFFQGTKTLPLLSSAVRNLKLFDKHQLALLTRGGFQLLDTRDLSLQNYIVPDTTAFTTYRNYGWDAVKMADGSYGVTTASGFYVFNKAGQVTFRHDEYQLKEIGQKTIRYGKEILEVNATEFLVFTNNSDIAYYNATEKKFTKIFQDEKDPLMLNRVNFYPLTPDKNRGLIAFCKLNVDEFIFYHFAKKNMVYYNKASNKTVVTALSLPSLEFTWETKITSLNDSIFLMNGGLAGFYQFHLNRKTGKIEPNAIKSLPSYKIQCLFIDKDKRLWAGTSKGLLQQKLIPPVLKSDAFNVSTTDSITGGFSCAYRYKDKLYLGRFSLNKGLVIQDTAKKTMTQIDFFGKNTQWNEIRSIQMYYSDTLWIGTNAGRLWFDTKTLHYGKLLDEKKYKYALSGLNILAPANKDGYAWMCSLLEGVVAKYHIDSRTFTFFTSKTQPALPFDKVKSIAYDSYGDVWIGGHSLSRYNNQKQIFDTTISVYGGAYKYQDDIVTLTADNNGSLWLHNAFNGLLEYRIKQKEFIGYTMKDGLPSDAFFGFSPVIKNQLWIASNNQLTGFDTRTKKIVVYDYQDGLPAEKPSARNMYFDSSLGKLYMLNQQTVTSMALPVSDIKDYSTDLILEELIVNNKKHFFYPADHLKLETDENNLSIHYSIINFEAGSNYQFAYKLKEADNWTELQEQRSINLTALPPGHYTLCIKGTGKAGVQKVQQFSFYIKPPFWQTAWFVIICCLIFIGFIYMVYRLRIGQISKRANLDKQLGQAEMKALHSQMNPHFIFNSLNSIREMILNNENREASHYLSKFAQLIRITLDQSGQVLISLRSTIEYLERYIEMEKIRNGNFTCSLNSSKELDVDETFLPPMLIQPFIENAIWHAVSSEDKKIHINVNFTKEQQQLFCTIDDNGIGINRSLENKKTSASIGFGNKNLHNPVGIANIKNRIYLLNEKYKLQSSVTIQDKKDIAGNNETGTLVTLHLPMEINKI